MNKMKLETIPYSEYEKNLPQQGKYILSQKLNDSLFVYQAFKPSIAHYAIANQKFGGTHYSFDRMSWIKPNFLWMMYRSGWASKEGQEKILAIEISKIGFEEILKKAVHSSFKEDIYKTREAWKEELVNSQVRLQWDPDHEPNGDKLPRKAIQLGLRGEMLRRFNEEWIRSIHDITPFVEEQRIKLENGRQNELTVIREEVIAIEEEEIRLSLGLDEI